MSADPTTLHDRLNMVTRLEVIDDDGRAYVAWGVAVGLSFQDANRTLKVFVDGSPDFSRGMADPPAPVSILTRKHEE